MTLNELLEKYVPRDILVEIQKQASITGSFAAFEVLQKHFTDNTKEQAWVITMNTKNKVINVHLFSIGGLTSCVIDNKVLFRLALLDNARSIIVAHNHPSGNLEPSLADMGITNKINEAANVLDIAFLDHLILTENGYYSFADEGKL